MTYSLSRRSQTSQTLCRAVDLLTLGDLSESDDDDSLAIEAVEGLTIDPQPKVRTGVATVASMLIWGRLRPGDQPGAAGRYMHTSVLVAPHLALIPA